MNKFIFLYIPTPTKQEARKIAKHLLSKKLIACAIFMVQPIVFTIGKKNWLMKQSIF